MQPFTPALLVKIVLENLFHLPTQEPQSSPGQVCLAADTALACRGLGDCQRAA